MCIISLKHDDYYQYYLKYFENKYCYRRSIIDLSKKNQINVKLKTRHKICTLFTEYKFRIKIIKTLFLLSDKFLIFLRILHLTLLNVTNVKI